MSNRWGNSGNSSWLYFGGLQNHCRWWLQSWNEKTLTPWKESYDQPRQHIEKQRHNFANKGLSWQSYGFPNSRVWIWELNHKAERWRTDAFELWCWRLESPSDSKEIQPVHPKGDQSWTFIGRIDVEAETPQYFGHLMWRPGSLEKTLMLRKIQGRRRGRQRMRWLDGITDAMDRSLRKLGISDGEEGLVCCKPWGCRVGHNWVTELNETHGLSQVAMEIFSHQICLPGRELVNRTWVLRMGLSGLLDIWPNQIMKLTFYPGALLSCVHLCDPMYDDPPDSCPWDSSAKKMEWVAISSSRGRFSWH